MSEEVQELENEIEANPVADFIDAIKAGDFNNSEKMFNDIISDKVNSTLDAERVAVAQSIFNEPDEDVDDDGEAEYEFHWTKTFFKKKFLTKRVELFFPMKIIFPNI